MTVVQARENQGMPSQGLMMAIGQLGQDAAKAGVFLQQGGLMPSAGGSRIRMKGGKLTVTDGPYAEAKEVVGGFAIFNTKDKAQAMEWATRFMALHVEHWPEWEGECEIRQMFEEGDGPKAR